MGKRKRRKKKVLSRDEVSITREADYIIGKARQCDSRVVRLGNIVLFSTETGDAWMLDPEDRLALCLARDGVKQDYTILETQTSFQGSSGKCVGSLSSCHYRHLHRNRPSRVARRLPGRGNVVPLPLRAFSDTGQKGPETAHRSRSGRKPNVQGLTAKPPVPSAFQVPASPVTISPCFTEAVWLPTQEPEEPEKHHLHPYRSGNVGLPFRLRRLRPDWTRSSGCI